MMEADDADDSRDAANLIASLDRLLPEASPLAQACFLVLAERDEARLAALAKAMDVPQALAMRAATELTGLQDEAGAFVATFTPGASPASGLLRLTPDGVLLAKHLLGRTRHTDH